ncbi:hypothetical protein C8R44DRAFT_872511 [Mycena epipterygia]|nr:hypothetical protein C8R44DRAFT_872511 [Mycena epipterygia]
MPWKQLTFLFPEDGVNLNDCSGILRQCSNLVSIKMFAGDWDFSSASPASTIAVLPFLRLFELHLPNVDVVSIDAVFTSLALPALKSLMLSFSSVMSWDVRVFSVFQERSPKIKTIELRADVIQFALNECSIDDAFLHALEYKAGTQPLAPSLRRLESQEIGDDPSNDALEAMIRSRWWPDEESSSDSSNNAEFDSVSVPPVACWESVIVSRGHSWINGADAQRIEQELQTKLKVLWEEGLNVRLCDRSGHMVQFP